MSLPCPSCGAAMAASDPACPSCGQARPASRPKAASSDDVLQYVKLVGILIVAVVVVVIVTGLMGPGAQTCTDCKGKKVNICGNCESGRNLCIACKGHGIDLQTHSTCSECKGKGDTPACRRCGGKPKTTCKTCKGTGLQPE